MQSKKLRLLSLLSLSLLTLTGCNKNQENPTDSSNPDSVPPQTSDYEAHDLNIYFRTSSDRSTRNWIWAWNDGGSSGFEVASEGYVTFPELGSDFQFMPFGIDFGTDYDVFTDWGFTTQGTLNLSDDLSNMFTGALFRSADGSSQTGDFNIDITQMKKDSSGNYNLFMDETKGGVYYSLEEFPTSPVETVNYVQNTSKSQDWTLGINVTGSDLRELLKDNPQVYLKPYTYNASGQKVYESNITLDTSKVYAQSDGSISIALKDSLDITKKYEFEYFNTKSQKVDNAGDVNVKRYYSSEDFESRYTSNLALGATIEGGKTTFRVYSPTATKIVLNLYSDDSANLGLPETHELVKDANGVFSYTVDSNLNGRYYTFDVTNYGRTVTGVSDPYARSSDANGAHSMVVDFNDTTRYEDYSNSTSWAPEVTPGSTTIMEMHTKDMTWDDTWSGSEANRGKFLGLAESGTKLQDGTATGFDYVKNLHSKGLTHVQIMPAYDFASVDETSLDTKPGAYNWGYDPQQYDAPEGSYSSDPNDGTKRVAEFQDFVKAYNDAGIGVVMDVVYNHMPGQDGTAFEDIFPGYYFRSKSYSGAGTDIASQRSMVRKFIVDSVVGWARDYHVSGFRFDLMGILDTETMVAVRKALDEVDPNIIVYGEGWTMFSGDPDSLLDANNDMATQTNLSDMGADWVGAFNDTYRDGMKGSVFDAYGKGYVQLAYEGDQAIDTATKDKVYYGMTGTYYFGSSSGMPYVRTEDDGIGASIAYVECHDNCTLHDTLMLSSANQADVPAEIELANASVLGSLSPAFFQVGQDFGRSKEVSKSSSDYSGDTCYDDSHEGREDVAYNHNSYNSSAELNAVKWDLLNTNKEISDSFNANLEARKARSVMAVPTFSQISDKDVFQVNLIDDSRVISFSYTDGTNTYVFISNYSDQDVTYGDITVGARQTYTGLTPVASASEGE